MQAYKKALKVRIALLWMWTALAVGLGVYDAVFAADAVRANAVFSFQCGLTSAMGIGAAACALQYGKALRDARALQRAFVRENDERRRAIRAKAGMPLILVLSLGMIAGGIIAGYWNQAAFVALTAAAALQLLVACGVKLVYTRIY